MTDKLREEMIKNTSNYQRLEFLKCFAKFAGYIYQNLHCRFLAKHYFIRARQIKRQQIDMLNI